MKTKIVLLYLFLLCLGYPADGRAESLPQRVTMHFADRQAVIVLENHPAVQDFLSMLPLTVMFEDYNDIEKIGYLPRKLHTEGSPASCDPSVGTFAYYVPWGNLSVFYHDFRHSDGLVPLGHIEQGVDDLAHMQGRFSVRLEAAE